MARFRFAATGTAVLLVLVGCLVGAAGASRGAPGFPVTIKSGAEAVTLQLAPKRIVSLSSTATEDLFAVGAGKQVVAVDDQSMRPTNAPRTRLSGYTPNAEAIAAYKPDLVVVAFDMHNIVAELRKLQIRVLLEPPAADLKGVYAQVEELGRVTGHSSSAKSLVGRLQSRVGAIVRSVPRGGAHVTVFHELGPDLYSADSKTFIGRVYALLGVRNIADGAAKGTHYPKLSAEYVLASKPDLVVLADTVCCGQTPALAAKRAGWSDLPAVQQHQVVGVPDDLASYWGPQIVDFLQVVARHVKEIRSRAG